MSTPVPASSWALWMMMLLQGWDVQENSYFLSQCPWSPACPLESWSPRRPLHLSQSGCIPFLFPSKLFFFRNIPAHLTWPFCFSSTQGLAL